jgi:hypothetical protein
VPNPDTYLNVWAMAWVAHQAWADPLRLFDSNAYYPHPGSFAYTESLLPQALQAAPVRLLGGSPLLAYNLVLLLTYPLAGLGAYLLALELSGSRSGAFLSGLGYAFCAYRADHFVHIQSLSYQWLPFALLALRRALAGGGRGSLVALFGFSLLQALSSGYYAVVTAVALGCGLLAGGWQPRRKRALLGAAAVAAGALVVTAVAFLPQRALQRELGVTRSRQEVVRWSARFRSYLEPGAYGLLPHQRLLHRAIDDPEPLSPGLVLLALGLCGAVLGRRQPAVRYAALLAAAGGLLSLGPEITLGPFTLAGPWEALRHLPGVSGLRTPARMGVLAILAVDLLAAVGFSRIAGRAPRGFSIAVGLLVLLESLPFGFREQLQRDPAPPPTVEWLARAPRGPVLESPWGHLEEGALYLYWSTGHWQPMVNGYGALEAPGNLGLGFWGRRWPAEYAARTLLEAGVRYLVVHAARATPSQRARIRSTRDWPDGWRLAARFGDDWIWERAEVSRSGR